MALDVKFWTVVFKNRRTGETVPAVYIAKTKGKATRDAKKDCWGGWMITSIEESKFDS